MKFNLSIDLSNLATLGTICKRRMGVVISDEWDQFVDLLKMRWDNIQGNHFIFIRHKTRKTRRSNIRPIKVGITEKIRTSLELVGDKSSPFVLGLLPDGYSEIYLANKSKKYKGIINRHLKKVSKS